MYMSSCIFVLLHRRLKFPFKQSMKICISQTFADIKRLNGNHAARVCIIENNIYGHIFDESVFRNINHMYCQQPIRI